MFINPAARLNAISEYYFSKKLKEIAQLRNKGKDIINLGIGSPDLPPADEVVVELQKWSSELHVHGYQSYIGLPELRQEIANWLLRHYSVTVDPMGEVLPLMGSKEGIMHISSAFLNPGDKVLVPDPGYLTYGAATDLVGAEKIYYHMDESKDWEIDFERLAPLPLNDVKLMWINFPNMPTGASGSHEQFHQLITLAQKHNFLIVNDNPYGMLFTDRLSILQIDGAKEVALELNSLSKSHNMAGWRLGWVAGAKDHIDAILKVKSNMDSGMFLPIQKAAIKALSLPDDWYLELNKIYKIRRALAFDILNVLNCAFAPGQEGLFVWAKAAENIENVEEWVDKMIYKAGVFITPGFIFGSRGKRFVRISLCSNEDALNESLERLHNFQQNHKI